MRLITRCSAAGSAPVSGTGGREFESRHFDHMKIIRTFSYLEKRSDYLFYLSIPTLIVRNENILQNSSYYFGGIFH